MHTMPRTAFITGAAKRVGREITLNLARQGWNIAIHYNTSEYDAMSLEEEIIGLGVSCCAIQGDLCQAESASLWLEEASARLGDIDTLILNASLFERDTLDTLTTESFASHITVNLHSAITLIQAFTKHLPTRASGNIICLGDGMKGWSISPSFLSYSLSKMALENLVTLLAPAIAPHARINMIALGATLQGAQDNEGLFDKLSNINALKRNSSPKEVCTAVNFLLQSPSVTGQIIDLAGGFTLQQQSKFRATHYDSKA
jgi:NAD(P)-dependent dehydrogenase (short-subunit alcohol dehydrogenase family)